MKTHTLPAADHARSHKRRALFARESRFDDGIIGQKFAELRNKLSQLAESEE